jgi:hypothetical protein
VDDDGTVQFYDYPDYVLITQWTEVIGAALAASICLVLVRRGPAPALVGAVGALATGLSGFLWIAAYRDWLPADLAEGEHFWEVTSYGRSVGMVVVALALVLALLRARRTPSSQHQ